MRACLAAAFVAVLAALTVHGSQQKLTPEPMRIEKVKDNLYVVRGPFNACAPNGCGPNSVDDGLLHEAGDVAVRVTSEGVILVDGNGGSAIEFVKTLNNLLKIDFDTVIPGHGRVLTKDFVRAYVPKLETMNRRMADLVKRRVPKDQLEQQLELGDIGWNRTVGTGTFMRSIGQYYDEMAAAK